MEYLLVLKHCSMLSNLGFLLSGLLLCREPSALGGEAASRRTGADPSCLQPSPVTGLTREKPWVGVVFFYWYTWDSDQQLGGWMGGIHNTPLYGYYDSRTYRDNYRSLQLAGEWGVTHHWMDYWGPGWKDDQGQMREKTVMRAAEDLRKAGYNIWMSYYQDGENFEMKDFAKNVTEKRDVHQWLRDFGRSPVWPRIHDRPMQLVYGRNGAPKATIDHPGFRQFLKHQYATVDRLNTDWETTFASFDAIEMDLSARGPQRAWSAKYQHEIWRLAWGQLNKEVNQQFNLPGMVASFDVGYGPYMNLGYAEFIRTFGGPHSYAGIFAQPHDQDAERFIQANVCKAYGQVFLDHYKNFYHDWDIRVPGFAFLPDPHHFDRFWVGNLMRYAEAALHLSWNEWWEGSNLEPCTEWGKKYCEKELFYSTLMQLCYESIRDWSQGARIALLLNDYHNLAGSIYPEEVTGTLQALRRLNCDFDLIADDFVTTDRLKNFKVIVAPAAGTGFGYNTEDKRIAPIVLDWVRGDKDRYLIVSADKAVCRLLGLKPAEERSPTTQSPGEDLNLLIDVGADGDDRYVLSGSSGRESFGKAIPGQFTVGPDRTFRWTPAVGRVTTLYLPLSPSRDHVLRLGGTSLWPSSIQARLDGREIGRIAVRPGTNEYEVDIPAACVGVRATAMIDLIHDPLNIPGRKDSKAYPGEARACNLALDWVQISTSNVAPKTTTQCYKAPSAQVRFGDEMFSGLQERTLNVPLRDHAPSLGEARALSRYQDGAPRDVIVDHGQGHVLYVNGLFSDVKDGTYWRSVLSIWTKASPAELVRGRNSAGALLTAGSTDVLLAYNYQSAAPDHIDCRLPKREWPLSEAVALSKDGVTYKMIQPKMHGDSVEWDDTLDYYAVYELAWAPVRVETGSIAISVGQTTPVPTKVTNLTDRLIRVKLAFRSVIPTLTGEPVELSLSPRQITAVQLPVTVGSTADWGRKTAFIEVLFDGQNKAHLLREVIVLRPPDITLTRRAISAGDPSIEVVNRPCALGDAAPALELTAAIGPHKVIMGQVPAGGRVSKPITVPEVGSAPTSPADALDAATLQLHKVNITCMDERRRLQAQQDVWICRPAAAAKRYPSAVAAVTVFNHHGCPIEGAPVELSIPDALAKASPYHLRDPKGCAVPAQLIDNARLIFLVSARPRQAVNYTLVRGQAPDGAPAAPALTLTDNRSIDGTVTVANAYYQITMSRSEGGTITHLLSKKTGKDYGLKTFDVNYGEFSQYDPNAPAVTTVQYIREKKTALSGKMCEWKRVDAGPLEVVVTCEVVDENVRCRTSYEFRAHSPCFRLQRQVTFIGTNRPQEVVAVDARFKRNGLTKSYPNFIGEVNDKSQPHFGWRYGNWVPDYLTLMTPPHFDESLSLIVVRQEGLDQVRQGFWPAERPKDGPCEMARIELIARQAGTCEVDLVVFLHREHQLAAARWLDRLRDPPLVTLTTEPLWR